MLFVFFVEECWIFDCYHFFSFGKRVAVEPWLIRIVEAKPISVRFVLFIFYLDEEVIFFELGDFDGELFGDELVLP